MSQDLDREVIQQHIYRILTDTGYCCRNLLGWNYDEDRDGMRFNVGQGGVRNYGSHQKIVQLLDDDSIRFKLIEAPRGSYKSTILQGFVVRHILRNPDVRIYYVSKTDALAKEKAEAIRRCLEMPEVTELFGAQKGAPWAHDRMTVASRRQATLQTPTLSIFSFESMPTGGRANIVLVDDPIDQDSCATPEQVKKSKDRYQMLMPFIAKGGMLVVVGTRYGADDLFNDLETSPLFQPPRGQSIILGAGVHIVRDEDTGTLRLEEDEGGLTFPHMTMDFLEEKFAGMVMKGEVVRFSCQYLNHVPAGSGSVFTRQMFQPIAYGPEMSRLSGYLLTDTAVSLKDEGCYSVIAYMGIDAADNLYILDLRVGHWEPSQFIDQFFDVLGEWREKVNHCGEAWEEVMVATTFEYSVRERAARKQIKLNPIHMKRYSKESKHMRIQRLHAPMHDKKLFVVDTVPRYFDDLDGRRTLWDPEGYLDARTKMRQPDGELVLEFVKFKASGVKQDVADTIAMILESDKKAGKFKRHCTYRPAKPRPDRMSLTDQRRLAYREANYSSSASGDWWERTLRGIDGPG